MKNWTPNMGQIIAGHNKKLLKKYYEELDKNKTVEKTCNCRDPNSCPLEGLCLTKDIVYKGQITSENPEDNKAYIGLTSTTFKERFGNHKTSCNNQHSKQSTTLSTYIWKLKNENKTKLKTHKIAYSL